VENHLYDNSSDVLASLIIWRPGQLTGWPIPYSGSAWIKTSCGVL